MTINFSIHKLSDILSINSSTISRWVDNKIKLQAVENAKRCNIPGQGNKTCIYEYENDLLEYIYKLRENNIAVTSSLLIKKIYSLNPDIRNKSYSSLHNTLYRILKRNNITLRKATHVGQPLPPNFFDLMNDFIYKIRKDWICFHIQNLLRIP